MMKPDAVSRAERRIVPARTFPLTLTPLLMVLVLCGGLPAAHAQTATHLYVNAQAGGAQTGANWANAFRELDVAVAAAAARGVSEVWVAGGTYQRPVTMRSGVAVFGGFAGTETLRDQRNPAAHPTIIDVSRAQAGLPAAHAVLCLDVAGAVLDGFTITGGQAASPADPDGGGLLCRVPEGGLILVTRCTITGNRALGNGGGVCVLSGAAWFTACAITSNTAQALGGGLAFAGMGVSVNECTIRANSARIGGGVAGGGLGAALRNCEILFNRAVEGGGGVATTSTLALVQCRLLENQAVRGGGVWCPPGASLTARGCTLVDNTACEQGGGMLYEGGGDLEQGWLTECTFSGNHAAEGGALAARTPLVLHGTLLSGNTADRGGALAVTPPGIRMFGCTLSDNAATSGGAFFAARPTQTEVANCIFSGNTGHAIRVASAATTTGMCLRYCLFANNQPGDYHDGAALWTGASQINRLLPLCFGNLGGNPSFLAAPAGAWSDPPAFDPVTSQTTLRDASAAFIPNALAGRLITFHPTRCHQALVLRNTANTITVAGDRTLDCPAGAAYQVLDYHLGDGSRALQGGLPVLPMDVDIDGQPLLPRGGWIDSGADQSAAAVHPAPLPDETAPFSQVALLPPQYRGAVLTLTITAADDYGGMVRVRLYYRRDGGPWLEEPQCEFIMRSGQSVPCRFDAEAAGGAGYYEFYSVAADEAGNAEDPPATPDAATQLWIPFPNHCVYVNSLSTGTQTGETWTTAYHRVSDGITAALAEGLGVVRVAGGRYDDNVELDGEADGLAIEGGYFRAADGALLRDPLGHPSILVSTHSYWDPMLQPSVVSLFATRGVRLDGLMLTGGTAAFGSGLRLIDCDASNLVSNCVITANQGSNGAGAYCEGQTSAVLSGCRILGNSADESGGGITISDGARPRLVNCMIWGNRAALGGALEITSGSAPELIHCTLSDNAATTGGAIACHGLAGAAPLLAGTILRNSRGVGAVAELDGASDPLIQACLFDGNAGGDLLDEGRILLTGAAAIDAALAEADGNFSGAAALPTGPAGQWSAVPAYSAATGCTTLTNSGATFTPGALVGRLLNADTGQPLAALVVANAARTVTVVGDLTGYAQRYDAYLFADPRPGGGSAAIDRIALAGAPAGDLDGNPRPFDVPGVGNGAPGATFDIGACEGCPRLRVTGTTSSGTLDFGVQPINLPPAASRALTLANQGSLGLTFGSPAWVISGPAAADFAVSAGFTTTPLAVGASRPLTLTFTPSAAGPRQARLELFATGAGAPLGQVALAGVGIDVRPVLTLQPVSQTVNPGVRVTFAVAAAGGQPLSWRWRKDGVPLSDGGSLGGSATPTLTISSAAQSDEGGYDCVVTNPVGQAVSSGATLTVNDIPVILTQPADLALNPGATAAFDVVASSSQPMTWRWYHDGAPLANGGMVSGADTPALRLGAVQQPNGGYYWCRVSNVWGFVDSRQALLNVNGPAVIVTQPTGVWANPGASAVFRVVAIGTAPLAYQWSKDGVALANGGSVAGVQTDTLAISGVQPANEGVYRCSVSNAEGSGLSSGARLAIFRNTLHIDPDTGAPNPSAGDTVLTSGTLVTARVTTPILADTTGTTRLACAGWQGSGAPAGPPTATSLTFALDRPSTITWQWRQQVFLDLAPEDAAQGSVSASGGAGWRDAGSNVTIQAIPAAGYRFLAWTGDLAGMVNPAAATLSRPLRAVARFIETTPPTGSIRINQGTAWTSSTAVTLTLAASDAGSGVDTFRLSNNGTTWSAWTAYASASACAWSLAAGDGVRTVYVQYRDRAGNVSPSFSDAIVLDRTAPESVVTAPTGTTRERLVPVAWSAGDPPVGGVATGIRSVRIFWRHDGGPWQPLGSFAAGVTGTLFDTRVAGGTGVYEFYAAATDQAGNAEAATAQPECSVQVNASGVAAWQRYE